MRKPPWFIPWGGALTALPVLVAATLAATAATAAIPVPGSMNVRWNAGSTDCRPGTEPAIQVHVYNATTYVLRESLCVTAQAPFMYLLMGSSRAMLIDTGDVAQPSRAALARTVLGLLPMTPSGRLPLLVTHTGGARDHLAGDSQFARQPGVRIVRTDVADVKRSFGLADWPRGRATIDLGGRAVDILPAPGHGAADVVYYDRQTALLFTGDFLQPGRLLVDDAAADDDSARRIAAFAAERPIVYVLGGHVEMTLDGGLYPSGSHFHPNERPLQVSSSELMALPGIMDGFKGVYARRAGFTLINRAYEIDLARAALAIAVVVFMAGLAALAVRARRWITALRNRPSLAGHLMPPDGAPAV